ncbi:MAG: aromatic ring-hydroxylating oxygenase subunit alpha, partial [Chloroflexota bacterium]
MTRPSPLTTDEIASVRKPYRAASLLPGRAYHDPDIFEFERDEWFRHDWVVVGREEDAAGPGAYFLAEVDDEPLVVVRGRDEVLRAFYNVCQHRGTAVVEEPCGKAVRFQCPYHAWIYDLDGSLIRAKHTDDLDDFSLATSGLVAVPIETWQGFVLVNLDAAAPPLREWLGDLVPHLERFDFGALRVAHTETYEVDANWKFIAENYSECYHCPGIHPQLNKLTPYDLGGDFSPEGP